MEAYENYYSMVSKYKEPLKGTSKLSFQPLDATNFMFNVQYERNNAGYTFDGFDSNGQNVPIQLKGNPIYTGLNDTYYNRPFHKKNFCFVNRSNVDENGTAHPPPPQIWLCRDTYFIASTYGLQYVGKGSPEGSQA